jgi:hypothetical protein
LNTIFAWVCRSFVSFERTVRSKSGSYLVRFGEHNHANPNVKCDWSCTCPSFRFQRGTDKRGYCKHIVRVLPERCTWSQHHDPETVGQEESGALHCPRCKGMVISMGWGV